MKYRVISGKFKDRVLHLHSIADDGMIIGEIKSVGYFKFPQNMLEQYVHGKTLKAKEKNITQVIENGTIRKGTTIPWEKFCNNEFFKKGLIDSVKSNPFEEINDIGQAKFYEDGRHAGIYLKMNNIGLKFNRGRGGPLDASIVNYLARNQSEWYLRLTV